MKSTPFFAVFLPVAVFLHGALCPSAGASPSSQKSPAPHSETAGREDFQVAIPGPLRSFLRMAGISQKALPEEVLPFLARSIVASGYHYREGKKRPTEFLILLKAYLNQARELQKLAGADAEIRISGCSDVNPILTILGYALWQPCGPKVVLQTLDPKRAFLAADSGFPLADLEEALRRGKAFSYTSNLGDRQRFSFKCWFENEVSRQSPGHFIFRLGRQYTVQLRS